MNENKIEEILISVFKLIKDYDILTLAPSWKRCWSRLSDNISSVAHQFNVFDFVTLYQKLGFLRVLYYKLYEKNIIDKCKKDIDTLKIDEDVKETFMAELSQVKHTYFDYDNILKIEDIKAEFTTFKYLEHLGKIEQANHLYTYLNSISISVGKELTQKFSEFLDKSIEILTKENYEKFVEYLDDEIKKMHKEVFGWP